MCAVQRGHVPFLQLLFPNDSAFALLNTAVEIAINISNLTVGVKHCPNLHSAEEETLKCLLILQYHDFSTS